MSLTAIRAFRELNGVGTSGQPTREQFQDIRDAGFGAVVNLALPTSDHALADEGSLVTRLGMAYVQLPVDFEAPKRSDFEAFCGIMNALTGRRVFVHCAANMRVSAFMFLYRVTRLGMPSSEAMPDLHAIWEPDPVWQKLIGEILDEFARQRVRRV